MKVALIRLVDLEVGDKFYIAENLKDGHDNIYLANSMFTVSKIKKSQKDVYRGVVLDVTGLSIIDEDGKEINCIENTTIGHSLYSGFRIYMK